MKQRQTRETKVLGSVRLRARESVSAFEIGAAAVAGEARAKQMPRGRYLFCRKGSHLALYDDQKAFFDGVLSFLAVLEAGKL